MPNGKGIQGPDFHHDGQNFAKPFDISFMDKKGKKEYVWQNTFAISTRMLGVLFAIHSDNRGLVLPPKIAPLQTVIIPILFDDSKEKVISEAKKIQEKLERQGISVHLDLRENYSPGWKFNQWELKGIPLRIELGPKDVQAKQAVFVRRDTREKQTSPLPQVATKSIELLEDIQANMYKKAKKHLKDSITKVTTTKEAQKAFKDQKIVYAQWCNTVECEEKFKEKYAAKSLNSPLKQPKTNGKCFACSKKATTWFYFGKSY